MNGKVQYEHLRAPMTPLSFLMTRFIRPPELSAGSMFALGAEAGAAEDNCLWRACQIRPVGGIRAALIEQLATGITKTVAVSVLLGDRTFHVVRPSSWTSHSDR